MAPTPLRQHPWRGASLCPTCEGFLAAGDDDGPHLRVTLHGLQRPAQLLHQALAQGVERLRPVQLDQAHALPCPGLLHRQVLERGPCPPPRHRLVSHRPPAQTPHPPAAPPYLKATFSGHGRPAGRHPRALGSGAGGEFPVRSRPGQVQRKGPPGAGLMCGAATRCKIPRCWDRGAQCQRPYGVQGLGVRCGTPCTARDPVPRPVHGARCRGPSSRRSPPPRPVPRSPAL